MAYIGTKICLHTQHTVLSHHTRQGCALILYASSRIIQIIASL